MGFLDFFTGSKAAPAGVARKDAAALRQDLLALSRDTAPFLVRDGAPEGCDLVAEWRIVDARWYEIFAKAGLTKVFKILMKLDADTGEVRALDQEWTVEWRAGVPNLSLNAQAFRGQKTEISFGTAYAFKEALEVGQVYEYRFRTGEIKKPLQEAVARAGWGWKAVSFGKL